MNIEIVALYPKMITKQGALLKASVHIRFKELGIEVRGILCIKHKIPGRWVVQFPYMWSPDDGSKRVRFPIFTFSDKKMTDELIKNICEAMNEHVKRNPNDASGSVGVRILPNDRKPMPQTRNSGAKNVSRYPQKRNV